MAELTPDVLQHAQEQLGPALQVIQQAQELIKKLSPPQPMDPSVVAQQDVRRQEAKDQADIALDKQEAESKAQERQANVALKAGEVQHRQVLDTQKHQDDVQLQQRQQDITATAGERKDAISKEGLDVQRDGQQVQLENTRVTTDTQKEIAADNNETKLQVTREDNATAVHIAEEEIKHDAKTALKDGKGVGKK
jgi:hypothetical protein